MKKTSKKPQWFAVIVTLCLVIFLVVSCEKSEQESLSKKMYDFENPLTDLPSTNKDNTLQGTKWKLVGIIYTQTNDMKVLEPQDCDKCYTIMFDTDSTFFAFSSANELRGSYIADYTIHSFQIIRIGGTKVGEIGDAELYLEPLWKRTIQAFSLQEKELRLYYTDKKNYLLFNLQES